MTSSWGSLTPGPMSMLTWQEELCTPSLQLFRQKLPSHVLVLILGTKERRWTRGRCRRLHLEKHLVSMKLKRRRNLWKHGVRQHQALRVLQVLPALPAFQAGHHGDWKQIRPLPRKSHPTSWGLKSLPKHLHASTGGNGQIGRLMAPMALPVQGGTGRKVEYSLGLLLVLHQPRPPHLNLSESVCWQGQKQHTALGKEVTGSFTRALFSLVVTGCG